MSRSTWEEASFATSDYDRLSDQSTKVPRKVQFVADLPKASTGKVMRRERHTLDA